MSNDCESSSSSSSPFGCIGCIVTVLVLWALIFGVTFSGKHYDLSCSCNKGVEVAPTAPSGSAQ